MSLRYMLLKLMENAGGPFILEHDISISLFCAISVWEGALTGRGLIFEVNQYTALTFIDVLNL